MAAWRIPDLQDGSVENQHRLESMESDMVLQYGSAQSLLNAYLYSLRDGAYMLVGWGGPPVATLREAVLCAVLAIAGCCIMAYVQGLIFLSVSRASVMEDHYAEQNAKINAACQTMHLTGSLRKRISRYHSFLTMTHMDSEARGLFGQLSMNLLSETRFIRMRHLIFSSDLFRDLPSRLIFLLVSACTDQVFSPGDMVVRKGEIGDCMYIILRGSVSVLASEHGTEPAIARLYEGDYFGDVCLVLGKTPRTAWIRSEAFIVTSRLDKDRLDVVVEDAPELKYIVLKRIVRKIHRYNYSDSDANIMPENPGRSRPSLHHERADPKESQSEEFDWGSSDDSAEVMKPAAAPKGEVGAESDRDWLSPASSEAQKSEDEEGEEESNELTPLVSQRQDMPPERPAERADSKRGSADKGMQRSASEQKRARSRWAHVRDSMSIPQAGEHSNESVLGGARRLLINQTPTTPAVVLQGADLTEDENLAGQSEAPKKVAQRMLSVVEAVRLKAVAARSTPKSQGPAARPTEPTEEKLDRIERQLGELVAAGQRRPDTMSSPVAVSELESPSASALPASLFSCTASPGPDVVIGETIVRMLSQQQEHLADLQGQFRELQRGVERRMDAVSAEIAGASTPRPPRALASAPAPLLVEAQLRGEPLSGGMLPHSRLQQDGVSAPARTWPSTADLEDMRRQILQRLDQHRDDLLQAFSGLPIARAMSSMQTAHRQISERLIAHQEKIAALERRPHQHREQPPVASKADAPMKELTEWIAVQLRNQQDILERSAAQQVEVLRTSLMPCSPQIAATNAKSQCRDMTARGSDGAELGAPSTRVQVLSPTASPSRVLLEGLLRVGADHDPVRSRRDVSPDYGAAWKGPDCR